MDLHAALQLKNLRFVTRPLRIPVLGRRPKRRLAFQIHPPQPGIIVDRSPGVGLETKVAGADKPAINDKALASAILAIWLGDKPIQGDLKDLVARGVGASQITSLPRPTLATSSDPNCPEAEPRDGFVAVVLPRFNGMAVESRCVVNFERGAESQEQ